MKLTILALLTAAGCAVAVATDLPVPTSFDDGTDFTSEDFEDLEQFDVHEKLPDITLSKRAATFTPTWCREAGLRNCVKPTWELYKCYNLKNWGLNNNIKGYQIPGGLTCGIFDAENCNPCQGKCPSWTWNSGTNKDLWTRYNMASSIVCGYKK